MTQSDQNGHFPLPTDDVLSARPLYDEALLAMDSITTYMEELRAKGPVITDWYAMWPPRMSFMKGLSPFGDRYPDLDHMFWQEHVLSKQYKDRWILLEDGTPLLIKADVYRYIDW